MDERGLAHLHGSHLAMGSTMRISQWDYEPLSAMDERGLAHFEPLSAVDERGLAHSCGKKAVETSLRNG